MMIGRLSSTDQLLRQVALISVVVLSGCASNGSGEVHGSVYMGVGYYDTWGWGACCYYGSPPVVVGPPPAHPPGAGAPRPENPIASPPPSRPAAPAPRPAARAGGGGRRR
jgi:hypothetical protein